MIASHDNFDYTGLELEEFVEFFTIPILEAVKKKDMEALEFICNLPSELQSDACWTIKGSLYEQGIAMRDDDFKESYSQVLSFYRNVCMANDYDPEQLFESIRSYKANTIIVDGITYSKDMSKVVKAPEDLKGDYTILDGTKEIRGHAFKDCMLLTEIRMPDSVESVGMFAFDNCRSLASAILSNGLIKIEPETFLRCISLTDISIPNSVLYIESGAFDHCESLINITIPAGVILVHELAFDECKSLVHINVDKNNKNYSDIDGVLYNKEKTRLIKYPEGKTK